MIKEIIKSKVAKIITVEFCIRKILVKIKPELATGFSKVEVVAVAGLGFAVWQITNLVTKCSFTADIPGILFIVKVKQSCCHICIIIIPASPHICIDKTQA